MEGLEPWLTFSFPKVHQTAAGKKVLKRFFQDSLFQLLDHTFRRRPYHLLDFASLGHGNITQEIILLELFNLDTTQLSHNVLMITVRVFVDRPDSLVRVHNGLVRA